MEHENFVRSKNFFFGRLEKQNVDWTKNFSVEKKCRLENFPCQKRTCPECPEFPVMQDRKTAEAGKKRPRAYRGEKGGGKSSFGKKSFLSVEKTKCWLEKNCRLKNKMSVGEFPLPKTDMSGMSGIPCNARPKNGRGGKNV